MKKLLVLLFLAIGCAAPEPVVRSEPRPYYPADHPIWEWERENQLRELEDQISRLQVEQMFLENRLMSQEMEQANRLLIETWR